MNQLTIPPSTFNPPTTKNRKTMEVNQYFSVARFGHLLNREFSQNKKIILIIAAVALLLIGGNALGWAYNREHGFHEFAYPFYLLVGGFILTSLSFTEMNRPNGKLFYLTLPASSLEKFVSRWLITGIGFVIVYTIGYYLISSIANGIGQSIFDFNIGSFNFFVEKNILFFRGYLAIQTIFLLGAVYFRKFAIFKTVLSTVFFAICLALVSLLIFRIVMYDLFDGLYQFRPEMSINGKIVPIEASHSFQRFVENNVENYARILGFWVVPAVLLVVGYFKLKETEL